MSDNSYFPVPESAAKGAHVDNDGYLEMYNGQSVILKASGQNMGNVSIGQSRLRKLRTFLMARAMSKLSGSKTVN